MAWAPVNSTMLPALSHVDDSKYAAARSSCGRIIADHHGFIPIVIFSIHVPGERQFTDISYYRGKRLGFAPRLLFYS